MQLVRVIDALPDLDASRIYYAAQSFGGMYGALFVAIEPRVRAAALNAPFPFLGTLLSPTRGRPAAGAALAARTPPLINSPGTRHQRRPRGPGSPANYFNENLPLRNQPPVVNTIAGAMAIQEVFDNTEWVQQSGGALAYATLLRNDDRPILLQVAKGDQVAPNPPVSEAHQGGRLRGHHHLLSPRPRRSHLSGPRFLMTLTTSSIRLSAPPPPGPLISAGHRPRCAAADRSLPGFGRSERSSIPTTVIDPDAPPCSSRYRYCCRFQRPRTSFTRSPDDAAAQEMKE